VRALTHPTPNRTDTVSDVSSTRGKNYREREHLLGLGCVAHEYIT
jgi:hypothetical protein